MTQVILPNRNVTGDNLWSQVETNDDAIASVVNGQIQNDNVASGADISGSKLAAASLPLDRLAAPVSNAYIADGAVTPAKIGSWMQVATSGSLSGATGSTTISWPVAFPNIGYKVIASATDGTQTGNVLSVTEDVASRTIGSVKIYWDGASPSYGFGITVLGLAL